MATSTISRANPSARGPRQTDPASLELQMATQAPPPHQLSPTDPRATSTPALALGLPQGPRTTLPVPIKASHPQTTKGLDSKEPRDIPDLSPVKDLQLVVSPDKDPQLVASPDKDPQLADTPARGLLRADSLDKPQQLEDSLVRDQRQVDFPDKDQVQEDSQVKEGQTTLDKNKTIPGNKAEHLPDPIRKVLSQMTTAELTKEETTRRFLANLIRTTPSLPKSLRRPSDAMLKLIQGTTPMLRPDAKPSTFALTTEPMISFVQMEPFSLSKSLFAFGGTNSTVTPLPAFTTWTLTYMTTQ